MFFSNKKTNEPSAQLISPERRVDQLERENELLPKVKDVADMRSQYSLNQFTYMEDMRNLWFSSNETIEQIRNTLAESATNLTEENAQIEDSIHEVGDLSSTLGGLTEQLSGIREKSSDASEAVGGAATPSLLSRHSVAAGVWRVRAHTVSEGRGPHTRRALHDET